MSDSREAHIVVMYPYNDYLLDLLHCHLPLVVNGFGHSHVIFLKPAGSYAEIMMATVGSKANFNGFTGKWFQLDAVCPIDGAVALGLNYSFLGSPGDNVGGKVFGCNKLLFAGVEELTTHTQHLPAVTTLGVQADVVTLIPGQSNHTLSMGNADVHLHALDPWSPLSVMQQCHGFAKGTMQQ